MKNIRQEVQLGEILNFDTGKLDSNAAVEGGEYPFFTCSPQTLRIDHYAFDTEAVLLAGNNANGIFPVKYYDGKFNAYQRTYIVTPSDKKFVETKYAFYLILQLTQRLTQHSIGTATRFLTKDILNRLTVPLPPLPIQHRIASILGALDDKIECNRRINQTLEQMAQALYKHWFVDSDVHEKRYILDFIDLDPPVRISRNAQTVYVEMKALPTWSMSVSETARRAFNVGATFQNGDTLLASITPSLENGKTAFVDFLEGSEAGFGSTEFIVMRAKENVSPQFVYCAARDNEIRERAIRSMVGSSGRQRVRRDFLGNYQIKSFDADTMRLFDEHTKTWFKQIRANVVENQKLARTRDYLLPKLMSGEIEVTDAEPIMETLT